MSVYYKKNGLKVRISDHEPNDKLNGSSDIELYIKSADNRILSVESQLEGICEKRGYDIEDFREILNDWPDGSYSKDLFSSKEEIEQENSSTSGEITVIKMQISESNSDKLKGFTLSISAKHSEIKALSELTGVSQSYIKKYFNIR